MQEIRELLSTRIRELRKASKLTQAQFAELADLSIDEIGKIERGVLTPSLETLCKIASGLKISLSELLNFKDKMVTEIDKEIESLMLYLRTKDPQDIKFISEIMRQFIDKLEQKSEIG
ncbi:helix-turn-helix transcriptional regulator [bacterium]|nr:helix-turn-helix transcriptional regulator [bacterium]MBU1613728.1 helix-turn-helix transcriptional regulator [bacterium]